MESVRGEVGGGGVVEEVVEGGDDEREVEKGEGWARKGVGCCVEKDGEEGGDEEGGEKGEEGEWPRVVSGVLEGRREGTNLRR